MAGKKQPKIHEYLDWRGDLTFEAVPLGEVDNLVFSAISYVDFSDVVTDEIDPMRPPVLLSVTKNYLRTLGSVVPEIGLMIPKRIIKLSIHIFKKFKIRN